MGLSDGSKGFFLGFVAGFGTGTVFREVLPQIMKGVSPLVKMSLKAVILVAEKSREMVAEGIESFQDLLAEVISELKTARDTAPSKQTSQSEQVAEKKRKTRRHADVASKPSVPSDITPQAENVVSFHDRGVGR